VELETSRKRIIEQQLILWPDHCDKEKDRV
jgi:hypothetical protein